MCDSQNKALAVMSGATTRIGLKPIFWMIRGTLVAVMPITNGITRKLKPVLTGEYPNTVCTYNVVKKNTEYMPAIIGSCTKLDAVTLRILKMLSGTKGFLTRDSFTIKNAMSAMLAEKNRILLLAN